MIPNLRKIMDAFSPGPEGGASFLAGGVAFLEEALGVEARLVILDGRGNEAVKGRVRSAQWRPDYSFPCVRDGETAAVLEIRKNGEASFPDGDLEILKAVAARIAAELKIFRLGEHLKASYGHLADLRAERDFLEGILGGTPNGVIALDDSRRVLMTNNAARRCFPKLGGESQPEGRHIRDFISGEEFFARLDRVFSGKSGLETVNLSMDSGPDETFIVVKIFGLRRGDSKGATLIIQDVTEQKKMDEQIRRMGRVASIGQLAAGVAHEIRNPLTGIAITLDILRDETGLSENGREMVADITREIDRLENLIKGLLDFARPLPASRRPMRLAKAVEWHRTFSEQCRKKGVRCEVDLAANPKIEGDPERLKQLFLNLAINALDATERGNSIHIKSFLDASTRLKEVVRVEVADDGKGMDEATVRRIFDPFFTTKNEGTGLGLSIAHSIVEQHGGKIEVKSKPGEGTTFTVELPCHEAE